MQSPPPSQPIKLLQKMSRAKFAWRSIIIFNFALGAYIFSVPMKKDAGRKEIETSNAIPSETSAPANTTILALEDNRALNHGNARSLDGY